MTQERTRTLYADRLGTAVDPRSAVGMARATLGHDAARGQWRRPRASRAGVEVVGLVLWWGIVTAVLIAGVTYAMR